MLLQLLLPPLLLLLQQPLPHLQHPHLHIQLPPPHPGLKAPLPAAYSFPAATNCAAILWRQRSAGTVRMGRAAAAAAAAAAWMVTAIYLPPAPGLLLLPGSTLLPRTLCRPLGPVAIQEGGSKQTQISSSRQGCRPTSSMASCNALSSLPLHSWKRQRCGLCAS